MQADPPLAGLCWLMRANRREACWFAARALKVAAVGSSLIVSGCVGMVDDYAKQATAAAENATASTIERRREQNDLQLCAAAAYFCDAVSVGAVARRYQRADDRATREEACRRERQIGYC